MEVPRELPSNLTPAGSPPSPSPPRVGWRSRCDPHPAPRTPHPAPPAQQKGNQMNNDDERDTAEEEFNRSLLRNPDPPPDFALCRARLGVNHPNPEQWPRTYDSLVEAYGRPEAERAWFQACREFDAAHSDTTTTACAEPGCPNLVRVNHPNLISKAKCGQHPASPNPVPVYVYDSPLKQEWLSPHGADLAHQLALDTYLLKVLQDEIQRNAVLLMWECVGPVVNEVYLDVVHEDGPEPIIEIQCVLTDTGDPFHSNNAQEDSDYWDFQVEMGWAELVLGPYPRAGEHRLTRSNSQEVNDAD